MTDPQEHPVWGVYDFYRTARLNVKYYSARLHRIELMNKRIELCIAITAPGSGLAAFSDIIPYLWQVLLFIASVAAIAKPVLMLPKKIKEYESYLSSYRGLAHDLFEISELISQKNEYDQELQSDYRKALKRRKVLAITDPETTHDRALIEKLQAEVNKELPPEKFFVPENTASNHQGERE